MKKKLNFFLCNYNVFLKKNTFFWRWEHEKTPSKVAHNRPRPFLFQYCQSAQIQPESQFLLYKNLPLLYNDFGGWCTLHGNNAFFIKSKRKYEPFWFDSCLLL